MGTVKLHIIGMDIPTDKGTKSGDYAVFYDEHGNALVLDAGQRPASAKLREWIKKQNFKRIWAVGTHAHTDHVNGIIDGINDPDIKIDKVWCVDYEYLKVYMSDKYKSKPWYTQLCNMYNRCGKGLYDLCKKNNIPVGMLKTGTHIRMGDIHCKVLWQKSSYGSPNDDTTAGTYINNSSPVFLFDFGYFTAGDNHLTHSEIRKLLPQVIIAQIPHHGNYVDTEAFNKLNPKAAWYNYGEVNGAIGKDKGFTSWTIPKLTKKGIDIWNNYAHGELNMTFTYKEVTIKSKKNGSKTYSLDNYKNWQRTDTELAVEVMLGKWNNGDYRKNALGTRYTDVQKIVGEFVNNRNKMLNAMADYTIRGLAGNGDIRKETLKGYYTEVQGIINERYKK